MPDQGDRDQGDLLARVIEVADTLARTVNARVKAGGPRAGEDTMPCPVCGKTIRYKWQPGTRGRSLRARCETSGCIVLMT